jgi:excisionase family DNA binding protein
MITKIEKSTEVFLNQHLSGIQLCSVQPVFTGSLSSSLKQRKELFDMKIWTIDEAALALNCSKGTIYNKVSKDEIPFHKKGKRGRLYFIPSEILDWIKDGEYR